MQARYRTLSIADHAALLELWGRCDGVLLREADAPQHMEKYLRRNPGLSFVAEIDGALVGSLMAGHDGRRGYILHLAVANQLRRQGIASRLLELCLQALKREGIDKSHVHVLRSNRIGNDFWSRRGWIRRAEIGLYSFVNGDNPDA